MLSELGNVYCGAWEDEETPVKKVVRKVKKAVKKAVKVIKGK